MRLINGGGQSRILFVLKLANTDFPRSTTSAKSFGENISFSEKDCESAMFD